MRKDHGTAPHLPDRVQAADGASVLVRRDAGASASGRPARGDAERRAQVVAYGRTLPGTDRRLALLGQSIAGEVIVLYAGEHSDVAAVVAVSPYAPDITATTPHNLEIIVGGLEPAMVRDEALRAFASATGGPAEPRVACGRFADGTARRMSVSGGIEHIDVLFGSVGSLLRRSGL